MEFDFKFTEKEIDTIGLALDELPGKIGRILFNKIVEQYKKQVAPKPIKVAKNAPKQ